MGYIGTLHVYCLKKIQAKQLHCNLCKGIQITQYNLNTSREIKPQYLVNSLEFIFLSPTNKVISTLSRLILDTKLISTLSI